MVDVNVNFVLGNDEPLRADFELQPDVTYTADIRLSDATRDHTKLYNRDRTNQHPMSAITGLEDALEGLSDDITAENNRATEAEETLDNKIDSEANTRADEITRVEGLISDEESRAEDVEQGLRDDLTAEVNRATNAEGVLQDNITAEETRASEAETTLQTNITAEENRAKGVEQQLSGSIDSNHQAISNHVSNKNNPHEVTKAQVGLGNVDNTSDSDKPVSTATQTALDGKVDKTTTADRVYGTDSSGNQTTYDKGSFGQVDDVKVAGVSVVTNKVANLGSMASETASDYYTSAQVDTALSSKQDTISDLSTIRSNATQGKSAYDTIQTYGNIVTHNVSEFATASQGALADTALQPTDNISELTNNLNYQTATQVANSIAVETNNRESADNNLQSQIDAIVSASDVFDIVGTYAELQAYDISTVPVNDIIKVLVDSTHSGAATYYRCVETNNVKSWSYIGSEGAYYTKAEADSNFVPQTRTVNSKALSSDITLTASDVGALPSSTVIPTVNDATVTIQKNGSTVSTFTLNQSSNETVNITVPTATSDLTNDSGFITVSALSGYATESWVNNKGYITGISSSDVTTALGYTPYDSSNPAGYITSSALTPYALSSSLSAVATSGAYSDLSGKPNYGAGLSYSSSSLQLLDQNGNNLGSAVTINSTPDLDGVTIDTNSSDELEAIGTVNKNTAVGATAVKYDWIGTLAEYNSQNVETLHPEWVCYITDDVSGGTSVYTKAEVDSAISTALTTMLDSAFPVGSRYITEASTCPLATLIPNSTWVLTSQGRVLQGADSNHASGTTAEAGLPNITGTAQTAPGRAGYEQTGAFSSHVTQNATSVFTSGTQVTDNQYGIGFNASNSNSIYGNSTTVQPPAEFVNIFKRTA